MMILCRSYFLLLFASQRQTTEIVSASALFKSHSKPLIARRRNLPANGTVRKPVINLLQAADSRLRSQCTREKSTQIAASLAAICVDFVPSTLTAEA
jgi:hypothetical protein